MFKKSRRGPRKIGRDDEEADSSTPTSIPDDQPSSIVKRPVKESKIAKAKKAHQASVRTSFAPDDDDAAEEQVPDEDPFAQVERKRVAANANKASVASSRLPYRSPETTSESPSYSKDYLASLKTAQQSIPRPARYAEDDPAISPSQPELDIAAKYGTASPRTSVLRSTDATKSAIPTDTEIQEKKERRRRLAAEQKADDFIALDEDGDRSSDSASDAPHRNTLISRAEERDDKSKHESRLGVHALDDDDFGEGFDSFVDDPERVALGAKARRAQSAARRAEIASQIRSAEEGLSADEAADAAIDAEEIDPDERARLQAYEHAQTRHGTYITRHTATPHRERDRGRAREERWRRLTTREYRPAAIPELKVALARFRAGVEAQRARRAGAEKALEGIRGERGEILGEEERVQELVREAGERLARVSAGASAGAGAGAGPARPAPGSGGDDRGTGGENGDADVAMSEHTEQDKQEKAHDDEESTEEGDGDARGLGASMQAGLGGLDSLDARPTSFAGMPRPPSPEW